MNLIRGLQHHAHITGRGGRCTIIGCTRDEPDTRPAAQRAHHWAVGAQSSVALVMNLIRGLQHHAHITGRGGRCTIIGCTRDEPDTRPAAQRAHHWAVRAQSSVARVMNLIRGLQHHAHITGRSVHNHWLHS